jgi:hypothetical protein
LFFWCCAFWEAGEGLAADDSFTLKEGKRTFDDDIMSQGYRSREIDLHDVINDRFLV